MALILAKSPVIRGGINGTGTYLGAEMDLYIYQGTQTTDRANGVYYSLFAEHTPQASNPTVYDVYTFDISTFITDFIESTYDGTWANSTNEAVWVDFRTRVIQSNGTAGAWQSFTQYYCSEGYGYFNDDLTNRTTGYQAQTDDNFFVLISPGTTLYVPDGELLTIPINANSYDVAYDAFFHLPTVGADTITFTTPITESTDLIYYWTEDGLQDYDRITQDQDVAADIVVNYIERVTEYKHTPIKIVFKNKFGALQEMWFFGKTTLQTSTTKDQFNRGNTSDYLGLVDSTKHSKVVFNKMGSEQITLNSGWQVEANNELFRQLFLSEYVWMHYEGDVLPVNVLDSNIQYKTSINDKLINYTINFEFAFNKILT